MIHKIQKEQYCTHAVIYVILKFFNVIYKIGAHVVCSPCHAKLAQLGPPDGQLLQNIGQETKRCPLCRKPLTASALLSQLKRLLHDMPGV